MGSFDEDQDSFLPLFDTIPDTWEEARAFLVDKLKKMSDMINIREIGWVLDKELVTGKNFVPSSSNRQEFRAIFRKVIDFSPLVVGVNTIAHGITFDANFTLLQIYGGATNTTTFVADPIPGDLISVTMDATNIIVTSTSAVDYDKAWVTIEYILEA